MTACPRCGAELARGFTPAHKVCSDCPSCGGRLVTLPVLRDGLGVAGVSELTRAAQEAPKAGCRCPACGNAMALLKVGVDECKVEIDVCDKCLSVWCDRGEFESLVPNREPEKGKASLHDLAMRASPEARERLAKAMLEEVPEQVDPADITLDEIGRDILRLVIGAPTLWRTVRPVSPIFAILLTLALPILQFIFHRAWHTSEYFYYFIGRCPHFWVLDPAMVKAGGFELPATVSSVLTFPFLQADGSMALILALALLPVFAVCERKDGHLEFFKLLGVLWLTSILAHAVQVGWNCRATGYLCGIGPIAIGFVAYLLAAYPRLRFAWNFKSEVASYYLYGISALLLIERLFWCMRLESYSFGFFALVACGAVGAWLGRRQRKRSASEQKIGEHD